jgi:hypothetical protein
MKYIIPFASFALFFGLIGCNSTYNSGDLDKCKLIVEELKNRDLPNDTLLQFYIEDLDMKKGLYEVVKNDRYQSVLVSSGKIIESGMGRGSIHVYKSNSDIMIFIETKDQGHLGEYGYGYSSEPNKLNWDHDNWGEFWQNDSQLDNHWWQIYFDLG